MNQEEFDNSTGGKFVSKEIDCFCGCGMENIRVSAWVETDNHNLAYTDAMDLQVRVSAREVFYLARPWVRLKLAWQALRHGAYSFSWITGKVSDWHELSKWILSINSVTEERKQEIFDAENQEAKSKKKPIFLRILHWLEGEYLVRFGG